VFQIFLRIMQLLPFMMQTGTNSANFQNLKVIFRSTEAKHNGQSRETGNNGYIRHKTKTSKAKDTAHYVLYTTMRTQAQIT
jgi:hypothetical protein